MERDPSRSPDLELPAALREVLLSQPSAAVTVETDLGTALLVKGERAEMTAVAGEVPVGIDHELYHRPAAPVIRLVTSFYDRPDVPLVFETFINVGDPQQRREYELLSTQAKLPILCFGEELQLLQPKRVRIPNGQEIATILRTAEALFAATPAELFDFDQAKAEVLERTQLIPFPFSRRPPTSKERGYW